MPSDQDKVSNEIPYWLKVLVAISLLCAAITISLYFWHFFSWGVSTDQATWGQFGDYVAGILNPIFSLTALFALLYTIVLQSKELRDSTKQLERSAKALSVQNTVLNKQGFEATYFQYDDTTERSRARSACTG